MTVIVTLTAPYLISSHYQFLCSFFLLDFLGLISHKCLLHLLSIAKSLWKCIVISACSMTSFGTLAILEVIYLHYNRYLASSSSPIFHTFWLPELFSLFQLSMLKPDCLPFRSIWLLHKYLPVLISNIFLLRFLYRVLVHSFKFLFHLHTYSRTNCFI